MRRRREGSSATPPRRVAARGGPQDDVRATAAWIVDRTIEALAPVDAFLDSAAQRFDERDRGLLTELVLGTLRWLRRLDHVVAKASRRRIDEIDPALRTPLRLGVYQLLFLDRVPAHAAVSEAVDHARRVSHHGGANFVNAVLRQVARAPHLSAWPIAASDPVERLGIATSHPDFLVRRWLARFGEAATRQLLEANNRSKPLHLLAFRDRGGREALAEELIEDGFEVEPSTLAPLGLVLRAGSPWSTPAFVDGDIYVQDEASQLAALLPPPRPGERVLDVAAAPGGKTFSLLAAEPGLAAVAADCSLARLATLRANCSRLRRPLPIAVADAGRPAFRQSFDRVVVDLPCSGTGTLRKHPELKWRLSESEIGRLATEALRLLLGARQAVKAGGLLIAITCSLEREENEEVFERFLASDTEFCAVELAAELPLAQRRWISGPGLWRIPTGDDHDGFTVQVARRSAKSNCS